MSREVAHFYQDKDEKIARTLNWLADLNGSTITNVTWTLEDGITNDASSFTTTTATIRVSGGKAGKTYKVVCHVTTAALEEPEVHFLLTIED